MIHDDGIREVHGCKSMNDRYIEIFERENSIVIEVPVSCGGLSAWQARYLASKLYRLSRRIRQRSEPQS